MTGIIIARCHGEKGTFLLKAVDGKWHNANEKAGWLDFVQFLGDADSGLLALHAVRRPAGVASSLQINNNVATIALSLRSPVHEPIQQSTFFRYGLQVIFQINSEQQSPNQSSPYVNAVKIRIRKSSFEYDEEVILTNSFLSTIGKNKAVFRLKDHMDAVPPVATGGWLTGLSEKVRWQQKLSCQFHAHRATGRSSFGLSLERSFKLIEDTKISIAKSGRSFLTVQLKKGQELRLCAAQPHGWAELAASDAPATWWIGVTGIPPASLAEAWRNVVANSYFPALDLMRGDRALSFLPVPLRSTTWSETDSTTLIVGVHDEAPTGSLEVDDGDLMPADAWMMAFAPFGEVLDESIDEQVLPEHAIDASFLRLRDHQGNPVDRALKFRQCRPQGIWMQQALGLVRLLEPTTESKERSPLPILHVTLHETQSAKASDAEMVRVRLGSFDLHLLAGTSTDASAADAALAASAQELKLWLDPWPTSEAAELAAAPLAMHADMSLVMALANLVPGGQDAPEIEQQHTAGHQAKPILFDLGNKADPAAPSTTSDPAPLSMLIKEIAGYPEDQNVLLVISSKEKALPARDIIVLDPSPFFVAKVRVPKLQPSAVGTTLAEFDSDSVEGAVWTITATRTGYDIELPPQAIGESQVKQPATIDGSQPTKCKQPELTDEHYVDFRFSPPARLKVFTTYRGSRRGAVEPPTNTRRIFGDASQRAPGAPLRRADFELLYGMTASVERDDLMVTELTADLGLLPRELQSDRPPWMRGFDPTDSLLKYGEFREDWRQVHIAFAHRLAVLSMRQFGRLAVGLETPDQTPKLASGVNFYLRSEADIRPPMPLPDPTGTPYEEGNKRGHITKDDGLAGGADWGFDSAEVYRSVWRRPKSDAGELADVHFSALGGWGYQKGVFDNRRTSIISQAAMGRTHFYSIERVGRICGLWNRCKHVVIYERSIVCSPQFPDQAKLTGRPIVRKMREFVEVLEPERRYPDLGDERLVSGPLLASRFRTTIIPVDSAWGEDVPGEGWKVPLWRVATGNDVFANPPQVELEFACDPSSGLASTRYECARSEQLHFFTNTQEGFDDRTDRWPPVRDVDCGRSPMPRPPKLASHVPDDPDQPLPSASPVETAFAPFTIDIRPIGEQPINLMAGRSGRAVNVVLENITLVRATGVELANSPAQKAAKDALSALHLSDQLGEQLARLRQELQALPGDTLSAVAATRLKAELAKVKADINKKIAAFRDEILNNYAEKLEALDPCAELKIQAEKAMGAGIQRTTKVLKDSADELGRNLKTELEGDKEALQRLVEPWFIQARFLVKQLGNPLVALQAPLTELVQFDPASILKRQVKRVRSDLMARSDRGKAELLVGLDRLAGDLMAAIGASLERLTGELARRAPKAKGEIDRASSALRGVLASDLSAKIQAVKKEVHDELPDEWGAILGSFFDKLANSISNKESDIGESIDALQKRIESIANIIKQPSNSLISDLALFDEKITVFWRYIKNDIILVDSIDKKIDKINTEVSRFVNIIIEKHAKDLKNKLPGYIDPLCSNFFGLPGYFNVQLTGIENKINFTLEDFEEQLKSGEKINIAIAKLEDAVFGQLRELETGVAGLVDAIRGDLPDLGQVPSVGLSLVRAFGDAPRVPGLDFNRERIGYYLDAARQAIDITPVTGLVDRLGQDLKALGMRLPTLSLSDGLVPHLPDLKTFDIGKLFPDFAGIRLDGLFKGLKLPKLDTGKLQVRHGVDPQTRRAWLEARVDTVDLGARTSLFDLGPVALALERGRFDAEARLDFTQGGTPDRRARGEIRGHWELGFAGQRLVRFRDTPLSFNDKGRLSFDLKPQNVELDDTIKFIERFVAALSSEEGGLKISVVKEGGLPVGVDCLLDLPVPPLTFGAFGISGMRLATGVKLLAYKEFAIATRFALGSERDPFTITICILGGTGWIDALATYYPTTGKLEARLSVAIGVSALLGINLAVVKGAVQLFVAINAEVQTGGKGGSSTTMRLIFGLRGCVVVIRVLHVHLELTLVAELAGGKLTGVGTAQFKVKLGFIKKSVSQRMECKLAGKGGMMIAAAEFTSASAEPWLATLV